MNEKTFLEQYDITQFDRPSVTVDMVIFTVDDNRVSDIRKLPQKSLKVLLVKRKEHPYKEKWALPGGFVKIDESLEAAAYRELKEETGVSDVYLEQLYTYGDVKRDPRGRIISTAYMSLVDSQQVTVDAGSDAEAAYWFDFSSELIKEERLKTDEGFDTFYYYRITLRHEEIVLSSVIKVQRTVKGKHVSYKRQIEESGEIAFDHGMIIHYALERLRNKLNYSDMAFHLLPELFTLTELQKTYEIILDKPLLKANFRRKMMHMVTETDYRRSDVGHRPSKLYRYNAKWQMMD